MPQTYAYLLLEQNSEDDEIATMEMVHVPREHIYIDKRFASGKERPSYDLLLKRLEPHDVLYLRSFDDLGNGIEELRDQWYILTKRKRVELALLDYPLIDTRFRKEVYGTYLSDTVLCVMEYLSEKRWERHVIQREGIERAREHGVRFGRPERELPEKFREICIAYFRKDITGVDAANYCKMPLSTFYKKAKELEPELTWQETERV